MSRGGTSAADPPIEAVAAVTQRLAVLLAAGVTPQAAWRYAAEAPTTADAVRPGRRDAPPRPAVPFAGRAGREADRMTALTVAVLRSGARAGSAGESIPEAIRAAVVGSGSAAVAAGAAADGRAGRELRSQRAWLALAAAWFVAGEAGAPLAGCLRELADAFLEQARLERELEVALAGPRSTARLVAAMPAIAVLFGALLGFDTLRTLFLTAPGLVCLLLGTALIIAGGRWSGSLVRRASRAAGGAGLPVELTAMAMAGGMSTERARALAEGAIERYLSVGSAELAAVDEVLALSRRAGVPAVELLRSEARALRSRERSAGQQRAARLGVTLMIPLGLCTLPAFMLLGVLPLLISVLSSTLRLL